MKIQLESGSPSSATHKLTQPSATLNRRYVSRPTNLAIEEAARSADSHSHAHTSRTARPSRLVNLRVHDTDLEAMRAAEPATAQPPQNTAQTTAPRILETYQPTELPQTFNAQQTPATDFSQIYPDSQPTYQPTSEQFVQPYSVDPTGTQPMALESNIAGSPYAPAMTSNNPQDYDSSYNNYGNSCTNHTDSYGLASPNDAAVYDYTSATLPASNALAPTPNSSLLAAEPVNSTLAQPADLDTRALAMSIAADYTAANLSAAMNTIPSVEQVDSLATAINEQHDTKSIDEIAQIASEAISSIQSATDPADIARQIDSLKSFAAEIKSTNSLPEIIELGDTIEKFVAIASKSTGIQAETTKKSTPKPTLSSKATRAANKVTKSTTKMVNSTSAKVTSKPSTRTTAQGLKPSTTVSRPAKRLAAPAIRPARRVARPATRPQLADDKDAALRKALRSVASMDDDLKTSRAHIKTRKKGGFKRFMLAFGCASACVAAIIYFVGTNIPDISVRVAAMQTGIEASYPSYIPRGFSLDGISSEDSKITLTFTSADAGTFTLIEEKSSWDSAALLRNYVEPTWQGDYTTTHEQGLTIYIYGANATWVNGGVLYKINAENDVLTKKQLRNIVTSIQ